MTAQKRDMLLWLVVLGAPFVWLCSFQANFSWAPWTCAFQVKAALYAVSAVALALEITCAVIARRIWKQIGTEWPGQGGGAVPRARIMALCGVVFGIGFGLIVIAQSIPELMLESCQ